LEKIKLYLRPKFHHSNKAVKIERDGGVKGMKKKGFGFFFLLDVIIRPEEKFLQFFLLRLHLSGKMKEENVSGTFFPKCQNCKSPLSVLVIVIWF